MSAQPDDPFCQRQLLSCSPPPVSPYLAYLMTTMMMLVMMMMVMMMMVLMMTLALFLAVYFAHLLIARKVNENMNFEFI